MDKTCVIVAVKHKNSFRWIWRAAEDGGKGKPSESYELFYECFAAARALGYQPRFDSRPLIVQ